MLKFEKVNDITIVRFAKIDRVNALVAEPVKEDIKLMFAKPGVKLILNLEGIKYVDSTGFGVFLSALKSANNNTGRFKLCCLTKEVMELFKLLQLHTIFEIFDTQEDCVRSFS